ncbi:MAG: flagellar basal body P-ring formation protein FlgA [Deltaproteobacteria bacterium]|nr:flagellar basal body P-ring formation protein FlgA [Deltaproteobacteria bacterium]MBW2050820.1 flagellar basal body P-ring formation protein FlgA [Deltaproteobacteria bacterium]MBW2141024.1 flagellar basal body P-ring formation protein FlgA [Deltaproteobacteria bacterium]MBW2322970.1 flagellar basal body P-ring formation protein FlgA [Deltaproteobacteria bacterium]
MAFYPKKIRVLIPALALMMMLTGTSLAARNADLFVSVKSKAQVRGEKVFLKDIAVITGPDCALKKDLEQVFITNAPKPGQSRNIRKDYLTYRLRSAGLPLNLCKWDLPRLVTVSRRSQTIKTEYIRQIFMDYLAANDPYLNSDWELIKLQTGTLPCLPAGRLTHKITPRPSANPSHLTLVIYLYVDGDEADHVRVAGQINLFRKVVAAARTIEKGQIIRADDLKIVRVNLTRFKKATLTDPKQVIGKICRRRRLHAGQPIQAKDLSNPTVVKRGDTITILVEYGTLRITTIGQAKQDGAVGEKIPVLNLDSKKIVMAKLLSPNLAQIDF